MIDECIEILLSILLLATLKILLMSEIDPSSHWLNIPEFLSKI
jgi:hypothetical protein